MKKILCCVFTLLLVFCTPVNVWAIQEVHHAVSSSALSKKPVGEIKIAFVFDGPSDKNKEVLETFKNTISKSLLPDYKAVFDDKLVFVGNWSESSAITASNKAMNSQAFMVISLGYMSSVYLAQKKDKNKYVVTIDQYGLRDLGQGFFNPVQQSVSDFVLFKKLIPNQKKTAILINENFYKSRNDWDHIVASKMKEKDFNMDFVLIPVNSNISASLAKIPSDVDTVFATPLFNLSVEQRQELYSELNQKKIPTFSSLGKEDVALGALLGTSTPDVDRKLAEATSFNIHGVLHGMKVKPEQIPFYEDKVIFINTDTADSLGYVPPLRLLNNAQVITSKKPEMYDLTYIFNKLAQDNKTIERQKYLVRAARRASISSVLRYLPTLRMDLGYQTYNDDYAQSYNDVPSRAGQFVVAMDQVLYSPDLVTNILVKNKKLKFQKSEELLTQQNVSLDLANLYVETLMLENVIAIQEESVKESRENLAIARVREKTGFSGKEETLRWAGKLSEAEQQLLRMRADYKNLKISINTLLYQKATADFELKPLKADDPAFFTSDLHIIDHVRNPKKLEEFTSMLVAETIKISPEKAKLRAAIGMKKAEMANYMQKFVLPNAKMSLEYGTMFDRNLPYENIDHRAFKSAGVPWLNLNTTSGRMYIGAEWKPIEGGHKFAEIARCKAELDELYAYEDQVDTEIEMKVRQVVNNAVSKYFIIEKNYKSMFAESENYKLVKARYLKGQAPINQILDAQDKYISAKTDAMNSQYEFFKELLWVQRALLSTNWTQASPEVKAWLKNIGVQLPAEEDFSL